MNIRNFFVNMFQRPRWEKVYVSYGEIVYGLVTEATHIKGLVTSSHSGRERTYLTHHAFLKLEVHQLGRLGMTQAEFDQRLRELEALPKTE